LRNVVAQEPLRPSRNPIYWQIFYVIFVGQKSGNNGSIFAEHSSRKRQHNEHYFTDDSLQNLAVTVRDLSSCDDISTSGNSGGCVELACKISKLFHFHSDRIELCVNGRKLRTCVLFMALCLIASEQKVARKSRQRCDTGGGAERFRNAGSGRIYGWGFGRRGKREKLRIER
jgi:hypothetical protein